MKSAILFLMNCFLLAGYSVAQTRNGTRQSEIDHAAAGRQSEINHGTTQKQRETNSGTTQKQRETNSVTVNRQSTTAHTPLSSSTNYVMESYCHTTFTYLHYTPKTVFSKLQQKHIHKPIKTLSDLNTHSTKTTDIIYLKHQQGIDAWTACLGSLEAEIKNHIAIQNERSRLAVENSFSANLEYTRGTTKQPVCIFD